MVLVCVCVCVCARACVCVCACVRIWDSSDSIINFILPANTIALIPYYLVHGHCIFIKNGLLKKYGFICLPH